MLHIHVDIETRSAVNLVKEGVYKYSADESTEVLCVCWQVEGSTDIHSWVPGEQIPDEFCSDPFILIAHNASFERRIFEDILHTQHGFRLPDSYICTMAMCAHNGYPLALANAAAAMRLSVQKDQEGASLMRRMCKPLRKTVDIDSEEYANDLDRLIQYCAQDVVVESEIYERLQISEIEQRVYEIDQQINDRGVQVDTETVTKIIESNNELLESLKTELSEITDGELYSPNQIAATRKWLADNGLVLADLTADTVKKWLEIDPQLTNLSPECRRVLEIRQTASLSSIKKYPAMLRSTSEDGRARGLFMYSGAVASGRWTSRRIQLQNLPRLSLKDDEVRLAVRLFRERNFDALKWLLGNPLDVAKELLRPMIYSDRGLVVGDWSSIELRVAAWLAGQRDLIQELTTGVDVYASMASVIYGVPISEVTKDQRQIGKAAALGCGYGLGASTFYSTLQRYNLDVDEELAERAVDAFRMKNAEIKSTWYGLADAALKAFDTGKPQRVGRYLMLGFRRGTLAMKLPSGRILQYHDCEVVDGDYGRELTCNSFDKNRGEGRKKLYGGLFFENACQATARDLLAETLIRATDAGYEIVASVHDEILVEGTDDVDGVRECMETLPKWAEGLPVKAECFSCESTDGRYTK